MSTYSEKLRDPRWQKKRLEVMGRDEFKCTQCGDSKSTLNIHHWKYTKNPWDAPICDLSTVCERCHTSIEKSKKSINDHFIKHIDFRMLIESLDRILSEYGEVEVIHNKKEVIVRSKEDTFSNFDEIIESAPDKFEDLYLKYDLFYRDSPSVFRGHMYIQHNNDERVIPFIDSMPDSFITDLEAIAYAKGCVSLVWTSNIPDGYGEGESLSTPCGDCWYILNSVTANNFYQ